MLQTIKVNDNKVLKAFAKVIPEKGIKTAKYNAQDFANLMVDDRHLFSGKPDAIENTLADIWFLGFMMSEIGIDETYDYLQNQIIPEIKEAEEIGEKDYYSRIIFHSPLTATQRENEAHTLFLQEDKGPLTDLMSCPRCGASKVRHEKIQTRSADEGATSIFTCVICNWTLTES